MEDTFSVGHEPDLDVAGYLDAVGLRGRMRRTPETGQEVAGLGPVAQYHAQETVIGVRKCLRERAHQPDCLRSQRMIQGVASANRSRTEKT